ncbi:MAG TPA: type II secretion system F family protein, partial [Myxococcota bacterium]|nr:type II secretion system F family protein [Myxococcota bacterium]
MPLFEYKGYSSKGKQVTGVVEADGPADLRGKLLKDGVYLTSFAETGGSKTKAARKGDKKGDGSLLSKEIDLKGMFERVKPGEIAVLTRQFGTLLRAGIPMTEALTALVAQQEKPKLKAVMTSVREKVREGSSLADALAEHRKIFTDLYINMVRVGEASGTLDIVLERLADFLESNVRLRSKVTSAMIYPILMAGVGLLIVALMMLLVVPRMVELFEDMGGELPLLTRILIGLSDFTTNTWFIGLPLTILAIWRFKRYINTEKGRWWWDGVRLRAPL